MSFFLANWKWLVSGLALLIYVAVQQGLYLSLIKACREFKSALDWGAAEQQARTAGGFSWIHDVRAMFSQKDGITVENAPLPREAVIDSLDNELWRASRYSGLQRWGLAAPLIGVILSALGFMVSPPELTGDVRDIMSKLGPLFMGVFVGALMALINQIYLHKAAVGLGRIRADAVRWFDETIWKSIRMNAHNALGQAAGETQVAAKALVDSSQQLASSNLAYRDSMLDLNRQMGIVRSSAQSTASAFDNFSMMIAEMTDQLGASIRNLSALNNTAAAVENGSVVWNVAAAKMISATAAIDDSTKKFHETCGNFSTNFDDVRQTLKDGIVQSNGGLSEVVDRLKESLTTLEGSIHQMRENTERHSDLSAGLTTAVEQSNQFLTERLALNVDDAELQREMASRTRDAIESLKKLSETAGAVNTAGGSLNNAAGGLQNASATIESSLKTLAETATGYSTHCAQLQNTMSGGVSETSAGLQNAAKELAVTVNALNKSVERVSGGNENHAASATRMDGMEKRLEETTQVVADSAKAMRQLQQGLDALIGELRSARESKDTSRGRWFSWLSARRPKEIASVKNGTELDERS